MLGVDPESGHEIIARDGRYGPYVTEVLPRRRTMRTACRRRRARSRRARKPRTGSLFRSMDLQTVTLEDALRSCCRCRGWSASTPSNGEEITAQNGRYGPYQARQRLSLAGVGGPDLRHHPRRGAEDLRRKRRGRTGAAPPLRELGNDAATGKPMVIGTAGSALTSPTARPTRASRRATTPSITDERASELLADRRARGWSSRRSVRKAPAKKAATKKPPKA